MYSRGFLRYTKVRSVRGPADIKLGSGTVPFWFHENYNLVKRLQLRERESKRMESIGVRSKHRHVRDGIFI
jgi:hypothetical protein